MNPATEGAGLGGVGRWGVVSARRAERPLFTPGVRAARGHHFEVSSELSEASLGCAREAGIVVVRAGWRARVAGYIGAPEALIDPVPMAAAKFLGLPVETL